MTSDAGNAAMLSLRGVWKSFDRDPVLSGINLDVSPGDTVALIGPSGCGKSTLLRLAIGLVTPDRGDVYVGNTLLSADNMLELRRRIGYVIQGGGLFPHLTARDNVALQARTMGWSNERIADRLTELAELTHLPADLFHRFPTELSGGQRQRLSLIRALMPNPDLLLLDEPLGALDPIVRRDLQQELREIVAPQGKPSEGRPQDTTPRSKTVVLVTHDLAEAAFLSRRLVLLKGGRIVQEGSMAELKERPAEDFVSRFVDAQRPLEALR